MAQTHKLTDYQRTQMCKELRQGEKPIIIARRYGITKHTVSYYLKKLGLNYQEQTFINHDDEEENQMAKKEKSQEKPQVIESIEQEETPTEQEEQTIYKCCYCGEEFNKKYSVCGNCGKKLQWE